MFLLVSGRATWCAHPHGHEYGGRFPFRKKREILVAVKVEFPIGKKLFHLVVKTPVREKIQARKIYMKIGFSSQTGEILSVDDHHGLREVTSKGAYQSINDQSINQSYQSQADYGFCKNCLEDTFL